MQKQQQLDKLYNEYLKMFAQEQSVLGAGNINADVLLIGEAPGKDEVKEKLPFVGAAGKKLEQFLCNIEIKREFIYITNAIKYRLYKINNKTGRAVNRPAKKEEVWKNREYLLREVELISPKYIVSLGNVPLKSIMGDWSVKIGDFHGKLTNTQIFDKQYNLFSLYHPASIIYNNKLQKIYEEDIIRLKDILSYKKLHKN